MVLDLNGFSELDKFHYLPRAGNGNGNLRKEPYITVLTKRIGKKPMTSSGKIRMS